MGRVSINYEELQVGDVILGTTITEDWPPTEVVSIREDGRRMVTNANTASVLLDNTLLRDPILTTQIRQETQTMTSEIRIGVLWLK